MAKLTGEGRQEEATNADYADVTQGEGVGIAEINRWKEVAKRFEYGHKDKIDIYQDPWSDNTTKFLNGESHYDVEKGTRNEINNPLRLVRPKTLTSVNNLFHYNGRAYDAPSTYKRTKAERGHGDNEKADGYVKLVKTYEKVAATILESLNDPNEATRTEKIYNELESIFNPGKESLTSVAWGGLIDRISQVENPQNWLVYQVISILNSDSDAITPAGRIRVLELLQMYSAKDLSNGFRNEKAKSTYYNSYDELVTPRLPYTFTSRDESLMPDHKDVWERNPRIQQVRVRDIQKHVDWRATATAIIERAPEEAIQIAMLLLHNKDTTEGALAFLQHIPKLDKKTLSRMFGKKATFILEHQIARGIDVAVAQGAGVVESIGSDLVEETEGKSVEELIQMLRRKERLALDFQESLAQTEAQRSQLIWKNMEQKHTIDSLELQIAYLQTGRTMPQQEQSVNMVEKLDPKGYYRIMGLHPQIFENLTDDEVKEIIKRHYLLFAKKYHTDRGGDEERIKLLNNARDELSDPSKRQRYGK